jgi:hypothetical protein
MKNKLKITEAIAIIKSNKFFSASFIKKDGEVRYIYGRSGVTKGLKTDAKPRAYNPSDLGYATIWDMRKKEYRLINLQTLVRVNCKEVVRG